MRLKKGRRDYRNIKINCTRYSNKEGLENILKAKTGALIVIGDSKEVLKDVVDGGFSINEDYTSSRLYELSKMDGAIVLSKI